MNESSFRELLNPIKGKVRVTTLSPSQFHDLRIALGNRVEDALIRMIHGYRIQTYPNFLTHFAAAFHWPSSRPDTWEGFTAFLADLRAADAGKTPSRLLMISHAADCLQNADDGLGRLLQLLVGASQMGERATFSVLLQEHRAGVPVLQRRLDEAHIAWDDWEPPER